MEALALPNHAFCQRSLCENHLWHVIEQANLQVANPRERVGLALISRDFDVLHANEVHLERWPGLIGTTCYAHCNSFVEPCEWCPVKRTFADGAFHYALAASPTANSGQLEYSQIFSIPVHKQDRQQLDVALEVIFNLTAQQRRLLEISTALHTFLKKLCSYVSQTESTEVVADLMLLAAVSPKGLHLDEAMVIKITQSSKVPSQGDFCRVLNAAAVDSKTEQLLLEVDSIEELEAILDARLSCEVRHPDLTTSLGLSTGEISTLLETRFPRRVDAQTLALCVSSPSTPSCLVLLGKTVAANRLLLDHQLHDAALLQALFCHAFDTSHISLPMNTALSNLRTLLRDLQCGGENVVFAAPTAFGLAHDLTPALNLVTKQITCLEAELMNPHVERDAVRNALADLKRAANRFKSCRIRLESVAQLLKHERKLKERCHLNALIEDVHDWLTFELADNATSFEFSRDNRVGDDMMHADKLQLFQVVYNLVYNSIKAVKTIPKQKRRITIRTFQPSQPTRIGFSVSDTAGSLLPDIQVHMYEPFYSTQLKGTGLGLWIVKSILDRVGGTTEVAVRPSICTTFSVLLPRDW
jgi:signal transduction histidine kinase